eukprot:TRINITY_DN15985_c0_g1_i1.p1 TRINITY_DN15985_c0_g1~~TRINITY_DN15985_c0_g1_i1.p1  ORF type:complete len:241 (-),score=45.39 TRINITY_DN15985_c0_g1_i1:26-724(-)
MSTAQLQDLSARYNMSLVSGTLPSKWQETAKKLGMLHSGLASGDGTSMIVNMHNISKPLYSSLPVDFKVVLVDSDEMLRTWVDTWGSAYNIPEEGKKAFFACIKDNELGESWQFFLGLHDGMPVGTIAMFLEKANHTGLYCLSTRSCPVPEHSGGEDPSCYVTELVLHCLLLARGTTNSTINEKGDKPDVEGTEERNENLKYVFLASPDPKDTPKLRRLGFVDCTHTAPPSQ